MLKEDGLTLSELLLTLATVGVLLTLALPAMQRLVQSNRVIAESNQLLRAVHIAKIEAAKHFREVVICPSSASRSCEQNQQSWNKGWLVFVNEDKDRPIQVDANERILIEHRVAAEIEVVSNRPMFAFHHYSKRSTNGTVLFCNRRLPSLTRAVVISYTGRPRVASQRNNGNPYRCER